MNLTAALAEFREQTVDSSTPYFWSDARFTALYNQAVEEACIRKKLLFDKTTIALSTPDAPTLTAGTGTLTAATYYYRMTAFNASGETLASTETSFAAGETTGVTLTWDAVDGATGYKIYGRSTGAELLMTTVADTTLTWTDDGSETPAGALPTSNTTRNIVKIPVYAGYPIYSLDSTIVHIQYAYLKDSSDVMWELTIVDRGLQTGSWRTTDSMPNAIMVDDHSIELNSTVDADYTLWMEVYRVPTANEMMVDGTDSPVIATVHHDKLLDWTYHKAYLKKDADTFNANESALALKRFESYFGFRPQANTAKEAAVPQYSKVWF